MSETLPGLPTIDPDPELERALADYEAWCLARSTDEAPDPRIVSTDISSAPPDSHLMRLLETLDVGSATDADLLHAIAAWERITAFVAARQLRLIAAFARRRPDRSTELDHRLLGPDAEPLRGPDGVPEVDSTAADELALELRIASRSAEQRLALALRLRHRLPRTLRQLESGTVSFAHARAIADETEQLSRPAADIVEQRAIDRVGTKTASQWRRSIKRIVDRVDASAARRRRKAAHGARLVDVIPYAGGVAGLHATLGAAEAQAIYCRLDQLARGRKAAGDQRTLDQLRADALVDAVLHGAGQAAKPLITITMTADTAAGHSEDAAHLDGYGPIDAEYARVLAASGTWRRITTDNGIPVSVSKRYRPPQAIRDLMTARHPYCAFLTCQTPSARCDFDHVDAHAAGGETSVANAAPECRRHHRTKHHPDWSVRRLNDGTIEWTTPAGRSYRQPPGHPDDELPTVPAG